jgi:Zn ribbon nucleic-acid-binding protein
MCEECGSPNIRSIWSDDGTDIFRCQDCGAFSSPADDEVSAFEKMRRADKQEEVEEKPDE